MCCVLINLSHGLEDRLDNYFASARPVCMASSADSPAFFTLTVPKVLKLRVFFVPHRIEYFVLSKHFDCPKFSASMDINDQKG